MYLYYGTTTVGLQGVQSTDDLVSKVLAGSMDDSKNLPSYHPNSLTTITDVYLIVQDNDSSKRLLYLLYGKNNI